MLTFFREYLISVEGLLIQNLLFQALPVWYTTHKFFAYFKVDTSLDFDTVCFVRRLETSENDNWRVHYVSLFCSVLLSHIPLSHAQQNCCHFSESYSNFSVQELSKLQDRVPAFSSTKAIDIIEKELGDSVTYLFDTFDTRPIAAASLGQVNPTFLSSFIYSLFTAHFWFI